MLQSYINKPRIMIRNFSSTENLGLYYYIYSKIVSKSPNCLQETKMNMKISVSKVFIGYLYAIAFKCPNTVASRDV